MSDAGFRALEAMIDRARSLGGVAEDVAKEAAPALRAELDANIAAGRAPDGTAWPLTAEGKVPLQHASKALEVRAVGPVIIARLTGPEARHHLGTAAGRIKRRILPAARNIPPIVVEVIRAAFARRVRGF